MEYLRRQENNPRFSLRGFARVLNVDQSLLSKILKGTRSFSNPFVEHVGLRLGWDVKKIRSLYRDQQYYDSLDDSALEFISDWTHFAILELLKTKNARIDATWMSQRLSATPYAVEGALQRLQDLGFVEITGETFHLKKPNNNWVNLERTSEARRLLQKRLLTKAQTALDEVDFKDREHAGLTMAIDRKLLPEIKQKLAAFRKELDLFIVEKSGAEATEVYQLCVAFFPLTKLDQENS